MYLFYPLYFIAGVLIPHGIIAMTRYHTRAVDEEKEFAVRWASFRLSKDKSRDGSASLWGLGETVLGIAAAITFWVIAKSDAVDGSHDYEESIGRLGVTIIIAIGAAIDGVIFLIANQKLQAKLPRHRTPYDQGKPKDKPAVPSGVVDGEQKGGAGSSVDSAGRPRRRIGA
jgi:hypothetical protein